MAAKVLFIDRDGTLIEEPEDFQVDDIRKIRLVPNAIPALLELAQNGFQFVMVSNQDGLGTAAFPQAISMFAMNIRLQLFESQGISFDEIFICPHLPNDNCDCRKPRAGLLTRYLAATDINLASSAVIGDRDTDMELAERIGVRGLRVNAEHPESQSWPEIVTELCHSDRVASCNRSTNETNISVAVNLDSADVIHIETGIGFYDHMLEQIAKHGGFGLTLTCQGDLHIDEHHTVEDTAICLGEALREALGNKRGIGRYGFLLPMDESEAKVSLDLSGRAAFKFSAAIPSR